MKPITRRKHLKLLAGSALATPLCAAATPNPVAEFMKKFSVPGLSLAIAKNGELIRSQGFGFADLSKKIEMNASHRFRIASVSKPITSIAIFLLIERGQLKLDTPVFGDSGILTFPQGPKDITVKHLLTHTSGGWQNDGSDPMFKMPEMDHAQLIDWALTKLPPARKPGENYAYSNFGYCLLGRIIEKISGQTYEAFVRENVLKPCGAETMEISGNTKAEQLKKEVCYYTDGKESTYPMNVRRMDSHGGWVGTPEQMVDVALHVDSFPNPEDILKKESIGVMVARDGVNPGYACGWSVNEAGNRWHGGSLPGLTTLLVRTASGYCWAACANTRTEGINLALDRLMWELVKS